MLVCDLPRSLKWKVNLTSGMPERVLGLGVRPPECQNQGRRCDPGQPALPLRASVLSPVKRGPVPHFTWRSKARTGMWLYKAFGNSDGMKHKVRLLSVPGKAGSDIRHLRKGQHPPQGALGVFLAPWRYGCG